ncbi:Pentatricopeptide repeat-containing protein, partial [Thalictrum thalictroides]
MQQIHGLSSCHETLTLSFRVYSPITTTTTKSLFICNCSSSPSSELPRRVLIRTNSITKRSQNLSVKPNLKRLTSRIVELSRRRQLRQIFDEIEIAKRQYGKLNRIVMNAVMDACVHCGDVDLAIGIFQEMLMPESCGVDTISFGIILKGLGEARRIDEAFQLLESVEQGTASGSPKLSSTLIYGLLNSLIEAGDLRRAHGLLARYRSMLHDDGPSIVMYNLLIKGYINTGLPQDAFAIRDEILRQGLKPDRLTYNTLVFVCAKSGQMDAAMRLLGEMKVEAQKANCNDIFPDAVTYTTLLKGFRDVKDILSVQKLVMEMKSLENLSIDRIAYTAIIDALLICGSTK